jgi:2-dehydro-3-deoxyphosphogluconate aldolase/(4S)-4-hydroxy-2-oxoglutarate aldolase
METFNLLEQLAEEKFLPLYTATSEKHLPLAKKLLLKHQLHFIEITYRSSLASQAITELAKDSSLIVGAGTVRNLETLKEAIDSGASFIVTPGFSDEIVAYCVEKNIPIIPGAVTPSEIMRAASYGLNVVKFFPADMYGGLKSIQSLSGPFYDMKFVPTGGINQENCRNFLVTPEKLAVGGSFILSEKRIMKDNGKTADQKLATLIKIRNQNK